MPFEVLGQSAAATLGEARQDRAWTCSALVDGDSYRAVLNSRLAALYSPGETVDCWVYGIEEDDTLLLSDSDFGRLPISIRMRPRYTMAVRALQQLRVSPKPPPNSMTAISEFKGMVNRAYRRDQWDWFTVHQLVGQPSRKSLQRAAQLLTELRNAVSKDEGIDGVWSQLEALGITQWLQSAQDSLVRSVPHLPPPMQILKPNQDATSDQASNEADPYIISRTARAKMERANSTHRATLQHLCYVLVEAGCVVEYNSLVDAFAMLPSGPAIFEVKSITPKNERSQIRHAVSQLYEYRYLHEVTDASLWVVLSTQPAASWFVDYLRSDRAIRVLWLEGDHLSGPDRQLLLQGGRAS